MASPPLLVATGAPLLTLARALLFVDRDPWSSLGAHFGLGFREMWKEKPQPGPFGGRKPGV